MYTHCPNCNTHFSITQEYLDIAHGKVRCGKCDYVFNALENLYNNEEDLQSPQLESAITASDVQPEQAAPSASPATESVQTESNINPQTDSATENSDPESLDTTNNIVETNNEDNSASGSHTTEAQSSSDPVQVQPPFTPPLASIDIKEKMERIAASLSAATQELKNARKSVGFERSVLDDSHAEPSANQEPSANLPPSVNKTPEVQQATESTPDTPVDGSNSSEDSTISDVSPTEHLAGKSTIEPEDTAEINAQAIANADIEQPHEPVEPDSTEQMPEHDPETSIEVKAEQTPVETLNTKNANTEIGGTETDSPETDNREVETSMPPALEEELELVDFSQEQEAEPAPKPVATDFNTSAVDESDIDILNSLIESQEHDDTAPESLIEELNDINKSLTTDDSLSLDEELSKSEHDFDNELDSGNDILSELEQLEKEFGAESEAAGLSDKDSPDSNLADSDTSLSDTEAQQVPVVEEEVVPSFLTQSSTKSGSPAALFGWLFATLVMLVLLGAQYLHFNSMKLADNPDFRPLLETLCPISGCVLPLRKAPEQIVTINHDVHTHPSVKDALEIQLSFKNKAGFTQKYPILEVIFSNPRGEVIASRRFSPDEYLSNKVNFVAGIKPNQTEKVDLQIVDPDPGALLSFQFNYL